MPAEVEPMVFAVAANMALTDLVMSVVASLSHHGKLTGDEALLILDEAQAFIRARGEHLKAQSGAGAELPYLQIADRLRSELDRLRAEG